MNQIAHPPQVQTQARRAPLFVALMLLAVCACQSSLGVPSLARSSFAFGTEGVPKGDVAELWVSYQITVDSIDGSRVAFRAPESCLYYRVSLPAGVHELGVRLDYASATHKLRTVVPKLVQVDLAKGCDYHLLDLGAGRPDERTFQPWLLDGAPARETLEVKRASR